MNLPIEEMLQAEVARQVAALLPSVVDAQALQAEKLYTVQELAALWACNDKTIREYLNLADGHKRKLYFVQGGEVKGIRISASQANAWIARNSNAPAQSKLTPIMQIQQ